MSLISKILRRNKVSSSVFPLETEEFASPKPFSEVPGPKTVPILGSSWKYLPFIGSWDINRLHQAGALKLAEFGHIVREEISSDLVLCHVFQADDIERVYKMEGRYPARRSHLALAHYRLTRPHLYNTGGLLPTNGNEWWRLRSAFQKHISPLHDVRIFLPTASDIIMEFIDKFIDDQTVIDDFLPLVSRLYLELMWMYMFGTRLRSFDSEAMRTNSVPSKLIEAAETVNLSTMQTDSSERIWKVVKTPLYRQMERKLEYIERLVLDAMDEVVKKKEQCAADDINAPLIEKYFQNSMVNRKDINGMAVDLLLGSVDTTSYTTSFLLYNLSRSKTAQRRLRDEATGLLSMKDPIVTAGMLNKATYTRAILKESFRLNPISIGVSRYLQSDTVFSGYLVPKGVCSCS